jgi:hypothetical protein
MGKFVKISVLENEFEAQVLESVLKERDIAHFLKSYHDPVYGSLYQMHKGWGEVTAPESMKEEILEILVDLRKGYTWEEQ